MDLKASISKYIEKVTQIIHFIGGEKFYEFLGGTDTPSIGLTRIKNMPKTALKLGYTHIEAVILDE